MNKKLLATLALVAMLSLASCGKQEEVVTPETEVTPVETTDVENIEWKIVIIELER